MRRSLLVACAAAALVVSILLGSRRSGAEKPEPHPRYAVVTTLPTIAPTAPRFAADDPRLLVQALGLDMRTFWLSPRLELSFAQGTKLIALDVIGFGNMSFTPTSFGGGTLTLTAPF